MSPWRRFFHHDIIPECPWPSSSHHALHGNTKVKQDGGGDWGGGGGWNTGVSTFQGSRFRGGGQCFTGCGIVVTLLFCGFAGVLYAGVCLDDQDGGRLQGHSSTHQTNAGDEITNRSAMFIAVRGGRGGKEGGREGGREGWEGGGEREGVWEKEGRKGERGDGEE